VRGGIGRSLHSACTLYYLLVVGKKWKMEKVRTKVNLLESFVRDLRGKQQGTTGTKVIEKHVDCV